MRQAARVYFETQVTTTSQGQVLIMLYDGAIKFLNQAKERIAAKDYAGKGKLISSAIDVINELASSLNAERGGDLAANLNQLYFYCNKRLFLANSRMDPAIIDEVIKILGGIRNAYAQIIDTPEAVEAMAQTVTPTAKGPRAPAGTHTGPSAGPPVSVTRARSAYVTQGAARADTPGQEEQIPAAPLEAEAFAVPETASPKTFSEPELPVAEAAEPFPELPDMDTEAPETPPSALVQGKRMAASSLYRKFAS